MERRERAPGRASATAARRSGRHEHRIPRSPMTRESTHQPARGCPLSPDTPSYRDFSCRTDLLLVVVHSAEARAPTHQIENQAYDPDNRKDCCTHRELPPSKETRAADGARAAERVDELDDPGTKRDDEECRKQTENERK